MSTEDSDDDIIRQRAFKISESIELEDILIQDKGDEIIIQENKETDEALGDIFDPFSQSDKDSPGYINKDGTVKNQSENDIVTDLAQEGEKKVNWALMVSMIVVFSGVSIVAGIALDPIFAMIFAIQEDTAVSGGLRVIDVRMMCGGAMRCFFLLVLFF